MAGGLPLASRPNGGQTLTLRESDLKMSAIPLERDVVLRRAVELGASDLILTCGYPVMVMVAGTLKPLPGSPVLSGMDSRRLAESFLTPTLRERFLRDLELDTGCHVPDVAHFRINL